MAARCPLTDRMPSYRSIECETAKRYQQPTLVWDYEVEAVRTPKAALYQLHLRACWVCSTKNRGGCGLSGVKLEEIDDAEISDLELTDIEAHTGGDGEEEDELDDSDSGPPLPELTPTKQKLIFGDGYKAKAKDEPRPRGGSRARTLDVEEVDEASGESQRPVKHRRIQPVMDDSSRRNVNATESSIAFRPAADPPRVASRFQAGTTSTKSLGLQGTARTLSRAGVLDVVDARHLPDASPSQQYSTEITLMDGNVATTSDQGGNVSTETAHKDPAGPLTVGSKTHLGLGNPLRNSDPLYACDPASAVSRSTSGTEHRHVKTGSDRSLSGASSSDERLGRSYAKRKLELRGRASTPGAALSTMSSDAAPTKSDHQDALLISFTPAVSRTAKSTCHAAPPPPALLLGEMKEKEVPSAIAIPSDGGSLLRTELSDAFANVQSQARDHVQHVDSAVAAAKQIVDRAFDQLEIAKSAQFAAESTLLAVQLQCDDALKELRTMDGLVAKCNSELVEARSETVQLNDKIAFMEQAVESHRKDLAISRAEQELMKKRMSLAVDDKASAVQQADTAKRLSAEAIHKAQIAQAALTLAEEAMEDALKEADEERAASEELAGKVEALEKRVKELEYLLSDATTGGSSSLRPLTLKATIEENIEQARAGKPADMAPMPEHKALITLPGSFPHVIGHPATPSSRGQQTNDDPDNVEAQPTVALVFQSPMAAAPVTQREEQSTQT